MYPTKEQITNRLDSVNKILQGLYNEQDRLDKLISMHENEQKALYLLDDLVKETQK